MVLVEAEGQCWLVNQIHTHEMLNRTLFFNSFFFLTSLLPQLVKFPGYTPENSTCDGPITNLPSILCILIEILSRARAKWAKSLNDFKFGTFIARFPSDGSARHA